MFSVMKKGRRPLTDRECQGLIQAANRSILEIEACNKVEGKLLDLINSVYSSLSIATLPTVKSAKDLT